MSLLTLTLPGPSAGVSGSLDSYCSLKPLCSGMGEVVPARTSPTLLPHPLALCCHYPVSKCCSASIVVTGTVRVIKYISSKHYVCSSLVLRYISSALAPLFLTSTFIHERKSKDYICFRLLWILCVLSAVVLFFVQVISRCTDFFKYNSNVNVEVYYNETLLFPCVTICNQNTYRCVTIVGLFCINHNKFGGTLTSE